MIKKTVILLVFSIMSLSFCLGVQYDHVLLNMAEEKLASVREMYQEKAVQKNPDVSSSSAKEAFVVKDLRFFLDKFRLYKFNTQSIKSVELEELFNQIEGKQYSVVDARSDFSFAQEQQLLHEFFVFLRKGVTYEVVFDHLGVFKANLMQNLDGITALIAYWESELNDPSFLDKTRNFLSDDAQKNELAIKIKKLAFFRDRVASFLGKTESLLQCLKLATYAFLSEEQGDRKKIQDDLHDIIGEVIFCIGAFFAEKYNPDFDVYDEHLKAFLALDESGKIQKLCKNHIDVTLIKDGFAFLLKEYQIPTFFRRHWFALSAIGAGTVIGGVVLWQNWDNWMSDDPESVKSKTIDFCDNTVEKITTNFTNLKNVIKENFWRKNKKEEEGDDKRGLLGKKLEKQLNVLSANRSAFEKLLKDSCDKLAKQRLLHPGDVNKSEELLKRLGEGLEVVQKEGIKVKAKTMAGAQKELIKHLGKVAQSIDGLVACFPESPEGRSVQERQVGRLRKLAGKIQSFAGGMKKRAQSTKGLADAFTNKHFPKVFEGIGGVIDDIGGLVTVLLEQLQDVGTTGKVYEAITYKIIFDILNLLHQGLDIFVKETDARLGEVDQMAGDVKVILNWVMALIPALVTVVLVPTIGYLVIRKIMKNRREHLLETTNGFIAEIYRIFVYYRTASFDCYNHDLTYRDQGMLQFWLYKIEKMVSYNKAVDRKRLNTLMSDIKDPDITISQKIDFIKLEWGNNLFGSRFAS